MPPKHKRSLINSMGPIDARFTASGLAPHSDALIEIARAAKQMPVSTSQASPRSINAALSSNVVPIAKHQLAGLLNLQVDGPEIRRNLQEKCKAINSIEEIIRVAIDDDYFTARIMFWLQIQGGVSLSSQIAGPFCNQTEIENAVQAVEFSIPDVPQMTAAFFVMMLKEAYSFRRNPHQQKAPPSFPAPSLKDFKITGALKAFFVPGSWNKDSNVE